MLCCMLLIYIAIYGLINGCPFSSQVCALRSMYIVEYWIIYGGSSLRKLCIGIGFVKIFTLPVDFDYRQ